MGAPKIPGRPDHHTLQRLLFPACWWLVLQRLHPRHSIIRRCLLQHFEMCCQSYMHGSIEAHNFVMTIDQIRSEISVEALRDDNILYDEYSLHLGELKQHTTVRSHGGGTTTRPSSPLRLAAGCTNQLDGSDRSPPRKQRTH